MNLVGIRFYDARFSRPSVPREQQIPYRARLASFQSGTANLVQVSPAPGRPLFLSNNLLACGLEIVVSRAALFGSSARVSIHLSAASWDIELSFMTAS